MAFFKKLKDKFKIKKKQEDEVLDKLKKSNEQKKHKIYDKGLKKSRNIFSKKLEEIATKSREINEELFEEIEEVLIMSDIGASSAMSIIENLKVTIKKENITDPKLINDFLFDQIFSLYVGEEVVSTKLNLEKGRINVIMVTGVNGAGKTTSIAKLAKKLVDDGNKVLLAAADTFRAGAVAQLNV
jgi:fused signal recognition particle receptor